ncbi:MAG TPA: BatD family protein [Flavobacteriales bacterium]|nr:BatD family protein [Flavobacteriales bacterium]
MRFISSALFLLSFLTLRAQDSLITVEALPDEVRVGQIYNVVWHVHTDKADVVPPDAFPGFKKIAGPAESTNSSYVNGVHTYTRSYGFSLKVMEAGELTLPVFHATVNGDRISCTSPSVRSLSAVAAGTTSDAMSKALLRSVTPEGTLSAYVHKDGAYITRREGEDEVVKRFLTAAEAVALEKYLEQLLDKK